MNNILVPGLESGDPKYRVCLHYRDWIPGEYIQVSYRGSINRSVTGVAYKGQLQGVCRSVTGGVYKVSYTGVYTGQLQREYIQVSYRGVYTGELQREFAVKFILIYCISL